MRRFAPILASLLLASGALGQAADYVDECPVRNGFFADAVQCDRYYECEEGEIIDHFCPDGLVFDESSTKFAKCSFPFSVNCADRPELQPAQSSPRCPRRNGYFAHEDPKVCDKFYFCVDGVANPISCPATLIFDPTKGQCAFSDQTQRKGCSTEEIFNFECPNNPGARHEHPRYADENDCQFFYICIGGTQARRNGCQIGQVFNPDTLACDRPSNVKGPCSTWYNATFIDDINNGGVSSSSIPGGSKPQGVPGRRVAVRRRRPDFRPEAPQAAPTQQQQLPIRGQAQDTRSSLPLRSSGQAATNSFGSNNVNRQRTRQRVRRPIPGQQTQQAAPAAPEPAGPPKFALSSDEDIQRFRDSNRFIPTSPSSGQSNGGGRLTVLSSGQRRPAPALTFDEPAQQQQDFAQQEQQSAFQAGRTRQRQRQGQGSSRRPPQAAAAGEDRFSAFPARSTTAQEEADARFSAFPAVPQGAPANSFGSDPDLGSFAREAAPAPVVVEPTEPPFHSDPFQTNFNGVPAAQPSRSRTPAPRRSQQQSSFPSRGRLEVTPIRPQLDLSIKDDEPADFEIQRLPGRQRQRSRGRQT